LNGIFFFCLSNQFQINRNIQKLVQLNQHLIEWRSFRSILKKIKNKIKICVKKMKWKKKILFLFSQREMFFKK
jgi:hypothetical protein